MPDSEVAEDARASEWIQDRPKQATDDDSKDAMAAALQERYQTASAEFQKLQNDLTLAVDARQKLEAQLSENELVKKVRLHPL